MGLAHVASRKYKDNFCKNPKFATINGKICCVNCDQYVENDKTKEQELCKLRKEESNKEFNEIIKSTINSDNQESEEEQA